MFVVLSAADRRPRNLVLSHHYSGREPNPPSVIVGHENDGVIDGAAFFCFPPTRWREQVLELTRLVKHPEANFSLSALVSYGCKLIKNNKNLPQLVVSFADTTHTHHGGIYQACSWNYGGKRKPACDGFMVEGQFVPRRVLYDRYGTSGEKDLKEVLALLGITDVVKHMDTGKHLYWRALDTKADKQAKRLELKKLPYPKPIYDNDPLFQ